jgi:hypothetical protein
MKLKKIAAGQYEGIAIIDGLTVRLEVDALEKFGFSYTYYVNNSYIYGDGYYNLRLKDIKEMMDNNISYVIDEYNKPK